MTSSEASRKQRRILLVDDSVTVRAILSAVLRREGWAVEAFEDAAEAAVSALRRPPDALVTDLWMPGISGLQLCRLLKHSPETAALPVVLITGTRSRRTEFWARESGADGVVDKGDAGSLPGLLHGLFHGDFATGELSASPPTREQVMVRLGNLLDSALFESVVAHRLRDVAAQERDVAGLFEKSAKVLSSVLSFRFVAFWDAAARGGYLLAHPADKAAVELAREGLRLPPGTPLNLLQDDSCEFEGGRLLTRRHELRYAEQALGSLALGLQGHQWSEEQEAVLALLSRELPLSLRLVQLVEELARTALVDSLTGLGNRRAAVRSLEQLTAASSRHLHPLSVVLLDVDFFKRVNDTYGHAAGDLVLASVGTLLRRLIRKADVAARWGGEEFLVVLPHTPLEGARLVAERLRAMIAAQELTFDGRLLRVTASLGVAVFAGENVDRFVARADTALYEAKRGGRDRVVVAEPPKPEG